MRRPYLCVRLVPVWIAGRCEVGATFYERAGALYASWRAFAHNRGEEPGSPGQFAAEMERRGFPVDRIAPLERHRIRWGVRIK